MSEVVYLDLCCLKLIFGPLDALHAAFAEEAGARWLVTTDDQLIALGQRHRAGLGVEITSPMRLLEILPGGER